MDKIEALYVRVSTEEQVREGQSLETQIDRLKSYARFQGWKNIEIFTEQGESAKTMDRPEIVRLIKLIKNNQVAVVCTLAVDRLSRNLLDMLQFIELCESHGAAYICCSLNFDTSTPIGRMVIQILAAFAEFERNMIATRVKSNMIEIANKNKRYMASPPFGYRLNKDGNLTVIVEEAVLISKAADMFIAGHGYRSIAKWLNELKICPTRKGALWSASTVRQMLINEVYTGKLIWNRRYYNKEGKVSWRNPSEWIIHENAHPAILTQEQWSAISNRINRGMPKGGEKKSKYRVSGLVVCSYCGSRMVSRRYSNKGSRKDKMIFVCSKYQKKGSCKFNYAFIDNVDETIYKCLEQLTDDMMDVLDENFIKATEIKKQEFVRREITIGQKFHRQIQAYENGLISESDLRMARERVERERIILEEERKRTKILYNDKLKEEVQKGAKQLLWIWNNGELPILQNTLRLLIDSIIILDGKIVDVRLSDEFFSL